MRCRAYPDHRLAQVLPQWIGCQRVIYNAKVEEDRERAAAWQTARAQGLEPAAPRPDQAYSHLKTEDRPWLATVPSQVLRNGAYRFQTAKTRQLQGLAQAPRKRKRHDFDSVLLTRELFRFREVRGEDQRVLRHDIEIGTAARPLGVMRSAWGLTAQCLTYKAERANKLVVKAPAPYSSQECSRCGHTSLDNRPTRARFVCTACGYAAHADTNAPQVLAHRGIQLLRSGALEAPVKPRKRVAFRQNPAGAGSPGVPVEPMSDTRVAQPSVRGAVGVEAGTSRRAMRLSGNPHCNA